MVNHSINYLVSGFVLLTRVIFLQPILVCVYDCKVNPAILARNGNTKLTRCLSNKSFIFFATFVRECYVLNMNIGERASPMAASSASRHT